MFCDISKRELISFKSYEQQTMQFSTRSSTGVYFQVQVLHSAHGTDSTHTQTQATLKLKLMRQGRWAHVVICARREMRIAQKHVVRSRGGSV